MSVFGCAASTGSRTASRAFNGWEIVAVHAGHDAHHDRRGDDLPAPRAGAPGARPASDPVALLPLLALARHRHGDQGVGRDPPQAPRQVRDRGRSAQPADARHQDRAADRQRALPRRGQEPGDARQVRPRHARRLARAQPLHALQLAGRRPDADHQPVAVRRHRRDGLGGADALDPDHRGRHHQRHRPLVGLSQLRGARREHATSRRGASSSAARSCTTTTTPTRPRPSCRSSRTSSTSAGSTSAASRCSAWPRCARPPPKLQARRRQAGGRRQDARGDHRQPLRGDGQVRAQPAPRQPRRSSRA